MIRVTQEKSCELVRLLAASLRGEDATIERAGHRLASVLDDDAEVAREAREALLVGENARKEVGCAPSLPALLLLALKLVIIKFRRRTRKPVELDQRSR